MLGNESGEKFSNQQPPETPGGEFGEGKNSLRIRGLKLREKGGKALLGIDMGMDMSTEPPAVVRVPARAAWVAIGLAVRALGLELVIDHED